MFTVAAGCSYQALDFFFDGVPDPGAVSGTGPAPQVRPAVPEVHAWLHAPVKESRCAACHVLGEPELRKTDRTGLCDECHQDVRTAPAFVHGPVAAGACLKCHDPHSSPHPGILRAPPEAICTGCHDWESLEKGEHHVPGDGRVCTGCHGPHGGEDRFFLGSRGH